MTAADERQRPGLDRAGVGRSGQADRLAQFVHGVGVPADIGQRHTMDGVGPGSFGRVVAGERDRIVKPALGSVVAAAEELDVPQFAVCLGGERVVVDAARSLDRL